MPATSPREPAVSAAPEPVTGSATAVPSGAARPIRAALVGAGFISEFHAQILGETPGVELVAICDADHDRAQRLASRFGIPTAVSSIAELKDARVDVAHVLVPPTLHAAVTRECLEAGLGAFVEKPLATSSAEARELTALAEKLERPLGVNHNAVHFPSFARLLKRVRAGEIGRVEHVQVTLSVPLRQLDAGDVSHWMFREPRNIVFEQGPHPFAQLLELIGPVRECTTTTLSSRELLPGLTFHERWLAAAGAEGGTAELYFAFGQSFQRSTLQVLGSDGSLQADLYHDHLEGETKSQWLDFWNSFLAGWRRGGLLRRSALRNLRQYLGQTLGLTRREDGFYAGMRSSIQAFYHALSREAPLPADGLKGTRVLEWCEAMTAEIPAASAAPPSLPDAGAAREGEVVVLGASGFIGRRTVAALLERDVPVTCIVRRAHSLPPVLVEGARDGRVRLVRGSLEEPDAVRSVLEGARAVIQLATGGGANWDDVERSMVQGSERIARAALDAGVGRFVYVSSTAALYLGRDAGETLADSLEFDPQAQERAIYARGKAWAERALAGVAKDGLPLVIARPGVVLGQGTPLQHSGLGLWVRDNHCVGWGPGNNVLPIVLVEDVADALVRAALHEDKEIDGRAMNLACSAKLTGAGLVAEMRRITGRDLHFHPRSLKVSQTMELGKWLVKKAGRQKNVVFPSWRDLKSRELYPRLTCDTAREMLGWTPVDDAGEFMRRALGSEA